MTDRDLVRLSAGLPPLEHYASELNFDKITEAIIGPPSANGRLTISEYDLGEAKQMIWAAAEKFLARDIYDLQIDGIEAPYEKVDTWIHPTQRWKGIIDLKVTLRGRLNVSKQYAGKKVILDWKTTTNTLDKEWENRLLDSWQWKKYLYFEGADLMIYRGLNREGKVRELWIERPADLEDRVRTHLRGVQAERQALVDLGLEVWPMRMPGACGAYGRECPHLGDCQTNQMPRALISIDKSFSYSSMDKFMNCPERYRRGVITEQTEDTEESLFGQAVHRGLAELYTQVKDLFSNAN